MRSLSRDNFFFYSFLAIIFIVEFFLFRSYVLQEIAPYYPKGVDQTAYLTNAYALYQKIMQQGFRNSFSPLPFSAASITFTTQAALAFLLFGASRFSALLLNFIYFIVFQFVFVQAAKTISQKIYIPLFALGLLLSCRLTFDMSGGMLDFRVDFMAFCLYGIFISCVLLSKVFLIRKWVVITALCAVFMILMRSISVTYVGMLGLFLLIWIPMSRYHAMIRFKNLMLFGTMVVVLVLPVLWLNWDAIYSYYGVGHVLGQEKYIRANEVGAAHFFSSLFYYPKELNGHLRGLVWGIGIILIATLIYGVIQRKGHGKKDLAYREVYMFLIFCIIAPLIPLTIDTIKSPVVANIFVPPVLWLLVWGMIHFDATGVMRSGMRRWLTIFSVLVLSVGIGYQVRNFTRHVAPGEQHDLKTITQMYQDIGAYAHAKKWPEVSLSLDRVCDYLLSTNLTIINYEKTGVFLVVGIQRLGGAIFPIQESEALDSLKRSNVVILKEGNYLEDSPYPFNTTVAKLKPLLKEVAERDFVTFKDYYFKGSTYRVYVRS